jgi:tetratricopeptide (TPR) repeat protein
MLKQLFFRKVPVAIACAMILTLFAVSGAYCQGGGKDDAGYYNQRGEDYFKKGFYDHAPRSQAVDAERNYALAVKEFKAALARDPSSMAAHRNLARVYFVQKNFDGAAHEYRTVTELAPADLDAYINLALALMELHKTEEAIQALEDAKGHTSDPKARETLDSYVARVRAHQGREVR